MIDDDDRVQLTLPSHPKYMKLVRALVSQAAQMAGFGDDHVTPIVLAVDEACTNIIRHCYGNDYGQTIIVYVAVIGPRLQIGLRDFGPKRDSSEFKSRDLDDVRPGGLGMHFIYTTMDAVEFDDSLPRGTLLTLTKTCVPVEPPPGS